MSTLWFTPTSSFTKRIVNGVFARALRQCVLKAMFLATIVMLRGLGAQDAKMSGGSPIEGSDPGATVGLVVHAARSGTEIRSARNLEGLAPRRIGLSAWRARGGSRARRTPRAHRRGRRTHAR